VDVITKYFEIIAFLVDKQRPRIVEYYGSGRMLVVMRILEAEVDLQVCKILDLFNEKRDLVRKVT
jgi:hypothetical protein